MFWLFCMTEDGSQRSISRINYTYIQQLYHPTHCKKYLFKNLPYSDWQEVDIAVQSYLTELLSFVAFHDCMIAHRVLLNIFNCVRAFPCSVQCTMHYFTYFSKQSAFASIDTMKSLLKTKTIKLVCATWPKIGRVTMKSIVKYSVKLFLGG
jgi:hypothetical protein